VAYAIIQAGGKQFRVTEGEVVRVPSFTAKVGASVEFDVLIQSNGDRIEVGAPTVDGSRVTGVVVAHGRAPKIIVFKKKRRKQYKKIHGHRQDFTAVRIESIGAQSKRSESEETEPKETETKPVTREATGADAAEAQPAAAPEATETASTETAEAASGETTEE
jgi:large subunit ribosomal protein L21